MSIASSLLYFPLIHNCKPQLYIFAYLTLYMHMEPYVF